MLHEVRTIFYSNLYTYLIFNKIAGSANSVIALSIDVLNIAHLLPLPSLYDAITKQQHNANYLHLWLYVFFSRSHLAGSIVDCLSAMRATSAVCLSLASGTVTRGEKTTDARPHSTSSGSQLTGQRHLYLHLLQGALVAEVARTFLS